MTAIPTALALWTALIVYGDGRVVESKVSSKALCEDAISIAQYRLTVKEKAEAEKIDAAKRKAASAAYEERVSAWTKQHPCSKEHGVDGVFLQCSLPDGGSGIYDSKGGLIGELSIPVIGTASWAVPNSEHIVRALCYRPEGGTP